MASKEPIYCSKCKYLAVARVDGVAYCTDCLKKKLHTQSAKELEKKSTPLHFVIHPEMEPPDKDKLKY